MECCYSDTSIKVGKTLPLFKPIRSHSYYTYTKACILGGTVTGTLSDCNTDIGPGRFFAHMTQHAFINCPANVDFGWLINITDSPTTADGWLFQIFLNVMNSKIYVRGTNRKVSTLSSIAWVEK